MNLLKLNDLRVLVFAPVSHDDQLRDECGDGPIVALMQADESGASFETVVAAAESLLDRGCDYFVCAGTRGEALHDYIDEIVIDRELNRPEWGERLIMTTWHNDETPADIAWFFVMVAGDRENTVLIAVEPLSADLRGEVMALATRS